MGVGSTSGYPRQLWFVIAMVLVLVVLIASIAFGFAPGSAKYVTIESTSTRPPSKTPTITVVTETALPTATLTFTPTSTSQSTPSPTSSKAPSPTATSVPSATPTATETLPADHYWLRRPISPEGHDSVARFYEYASRADGTYPIHHGVEFVNPTGTSILATAPGTIVVAGDDLNQVYGARTDFYGKLMIQKLDRSFEGKPVYVLYGHLSEVKAEVDQHVKAGDLIGLVGMTGVAEGPHVHMEVRYGENDYAKTVNPELWLLPHEDFGSLAGSVLSPTGEPIPEVKLILYRAAAPEKAVREVMTYPDTEVNADPAWNENFGSGDLKAGEWLVKLYHKGRLYTKNVSINAGATTWLVIRTTH